MHKIVRRLCYSCFVLPIISGVIFGTLASASPDSTDFKPVEFLYEVYSKNQILILAHAGHEDYRSYLLLKSLLNKIGHDERLKKIILERPRDTRNLYQELSIKPSLEVLKDYPFKNKFSKENSLCEPEWAYSIVNFLPIVQKINLHRKLPISVTTIDSIRSDKPMVPADQLGKPIAPVDCDLTGDYLTIFAASGNREVQTAHNFDNDIISDLKKNEKIIILYHYAHASKNLTSCLPFQNNNKEWFSKLTPANWLAYSLSKNAELENRMAVVLIDGEVEKGFSPGILKIGNRLKAPKYLKHWAIETSKIPNAPEVGKDIFLEQSFLANYHSGQIFGAATVTKVYDGYVWMKSPSKFKLESSSYYLPEYCGLRGMEQK